MEKPQYSIVNTERYVLIACAWLIAGGLVGVAQYLLIYRANLWFIMLFPALGGMVLGGIMAYSLKLLKVKFLHLNLAFTLISGILACVLPIVLVYFIDFCAESYMGIPFCSVIDFRQFLDIMAETGTTINASTYGVSTAKGIEITGIGFWAFALIETAILIGVTGYVVFLQEMQPFDVLTQKWAHTEKVSLLADRATWAAAQKGDKGKLKEMIESAEAVFVIEKVNPGKHRVKLGIHTLNEKTYFSDHFTYYLLKPELAATLRKRVGITA